MTLIENAVGIADLAKVTSSTTDEVEAEALDLDVVVGRDWAGRPAVTVVDAAGIVSGTTRRERDERARWQAHAARPDHWERARKNARAFAWQEAHDEGVRRGRGASVAADEGH